MFYTKTNFQLPTHTHALICVYVRYDQCACVGLQCGIRIHLALIDICSTLPK